MSVLPRTECVPVIRTDFSDDDTWSAIGTALQQPVEYHALRALREATGRPEMTFRAYVELLDDPAYDGLTADQLLDLVPENYEHSFLLIADHVTISGPEHTLLVVDVADEPGRGFRALPIAVQSIENNLSIANMDFADFADNVGDDGIFRGFPGARFSAS